MDERGRLISSGQWLELKNQNTNRYKTAQELLKKSYEISRYQRDTEVEDPMPLVKQEHELLEDYSVGAEMRRNFKMRCIIPRIAKLREPDGHEMKLTRGLQIKTPNFEIFSKAILHVSTRKQLAQTVKLLAMLNGFRLIVP